ncbi:MAG: GNAT family N-acetyltransferase [Kangiellaceae bacterium]|nr:GNAT family N-acetyltransferase [Kangiellaceae bacterium]
MQRPLAEVVISTDKSKLDLKSTYEFLSQESYWAKGIPYDVFSRSIEHSLCFGAYLGQLQVAFARVITDFATYGYLADVFVLPGYRQQGISKKLVEAVVAHPQLTELRRITLATSDAHGLYKQFGFKQLAKPEIFMELHRPNLY